MYPDPLMPELDDPESKAWDLGGRVHNWQNHIGEETRSIWGSFSSLQKMALAQDADDLAGKEYWD